MHECLKKWRCEIKNLSFEQHSSGLKTTWSGPFDEESLIVVHFEFAFPLKKEVSTIEFMERFGSSESLKKLLEGQQNTSSYHQMKMVKQVKNHKVPASGFVNPMARQTV